MSTAGPSTAASVAAPPWPGPCGSEEEYRDELAFREQRAAQYPGNSYYDASADSLRLTHRALVAEAALDAAEDSAEQLRVLRASLEALTPTLERLADRPSGNCVHLDDWGARDTDRCPRCCARRILRLLASTNATGPTTDKA